MSFMVAATVISTAFTVVSSISAGNNARREAENQANYQRQMAAYNAQVQENNARSIRDQTSAAEDSRRRALRIQQGKERASIAQSGLTDSGSLLDVYDQNAVFNELDILNSRYSGETEARGLAAQAQVTSWSGNREADFTQMRGKNAQTAGYLNAGASLLSGFSSGYGQYKKLPTTAATGYRKGAPLS